MFNKQLTLSRERKSGNVFIVLCIVIFLLKGIFYAGYFMPAKPGFSPDDVEHISYVMYLADKHEPPILNETNMERTVRQSYLDRLQGKGTDGQEYIVNTQSYDESENGLNYIAQHPPLYYLYLLPFYLITILFTSKLSTIILALRLATIPLGVATMLFLHKTLKLLDASELVHKCVMICFVFSAAIQFYLTAVNNDAMVICLSTGAFYYFIRHLKERQTKDLYIFAALCGGITITKYTGAVILPIYAGMYLYHTLFVQRVPIKEFIKQACVCIGIFGIIVASVLLQNYMRYKIIFPTADNNDPLYDYSLFCFMSESTYFKEIYRHIICWIGGFDWIFATNNMCFLTAVVIGIIYIIKSWKNIGMSIAPFLLTVAMHLILGVDIVTGVAINVSLCMLGLALSKYDLPKHTLEKQVVILSVGMILFYVTVFFIKHYQIFLHRGGTGATHGRYYYVLLAPFFWLVFRNLDKYKNKIVPYIPLFLLIICLYSEISVIIMGFRMW